MDPMSNALVREKVLSFCPPETLKNSRLVSKEWHHASLKHWRGNAVLRLCRDEVKGKCSKWICPKEFFQLFQSDDDHNTLQLRKYPFRNFVISSEFSRYLEDSRANAKSVYENARHVILEDYEDKYDTFLKLLLKFTSLKSLEAIDLCLFLKPEDVPLEFENVTSLKIKFRSTNADPYKRWGSFVSCFPKLESVSIERSCQHYEISWREQCHQILECLKDIKGLRTSLKELEIVDLHREKNCELDKASLNSIASCNFPLVRITLDVTWKKTYPSTANHFRTLVESCKNTLQFLRASFNGASSNSKSAFLELPKLEEVHIVNGLQWGLDFLSTLELPQLRKLTVEHFDETMDIDETLIQEVFPPGRWVHEKVEILQFFHPQWTPRPSLVEMLGLMMPNLSYLSIPLNKTTFPIVCAGFEKLKSLHVLHAPHNSSELDLDDETLSSITNLSHITHLYIACRNEPKFTFRSVRDGFLHLHELEYLSVRFKVLTPHAKTLLLNHLKKRHGYVDFQDQAEDSDYERCCCFLRSACSNCGKIHTQRIYNTYRKYFTLNLDEYSSEVPLDFQVIGSIVPALKVCNLFPSEYWSNVYKTLAVVLTCYNVIDWKKAFDQTEPGTRKDMVKMAKDLLLGENLLAVQQTLLRSRSQLNMLDEDRKNALYESLLIPMEGRLNQQRDWAGNILPYDARRYRCLLSSVLESCFTTTKMKSFTMWFLYKILGLSRRARPDFLDFAEEVFGDEFRAYVQFTINNVSLPCGRLTQPLTMEGFLEDALVFQVDP